MAAKASAPGKKDSPVVAQWRAELAGAAEVSTEAVLAVVKRIREAVPANTADSAALDPVIKASMQHAEQIDDAADGAHKTEA